MPIPATLMQEPCFPKLLAQFGEIDLTELLIRLNGQLECCAFQMIDENLQIVRLNVCVLWRASEKVIGMLHDELVQRSR